MTVFPRPDGRRWHRWVVCGLALALLGCRGEVPGPVAGETSAARAGSSLKLRRVILLTNGNSPFWDAAAAGARDAESDLRLEQAGLDVVVDRNDFKVEGQLDKLRQYAAAGDVAAVGISVTDAHNRAIADEMRRLREAGIHVVTIDSDVDRTVSRDARFAYLGTDNSIAGRELGAAAKGLRPQGGKYATFVGLKGAANAVERIRGFQQGAGENFELIENLADGGDPVVAKTNVRDALDRNADLQVLVGIWSYNTPAIVDIVKELGLRQRVTIVGFDADPPAIRGMQEGHVDALVVQNPYQMGFQGVRLLQALVQDDQQTIREMFPAHGQPDGDLYDTGLKVVVPGAQSPLKAELFAERTEFLTLEAFQQWLQRYGLTGS